MSLKTEWTWPTWHRRRLKTGLQVSAGLRVCKVCHNECIFRFHGVVAHWVGMMYWCEYSRGGAQR